MTAGVIYMAQRLHDIAILNTTSGKHIVSCLIPRTDQAMPFDEEHRLLEPKELAIAISDLNCTCMHGKEASYFLCPGAFWRGVLSYWISEFVRKESQCAYADTLGTPFMVRALVGMGGLSITFHRNSSFSIQL